MLKSIINIRYPWVETKSVKMKKIIKNIGFALVIVGIPVALLSSVILLVEYPKMTASVSSVKKLSHCGKGVITDLIKTYTGRLATNSEIYAASQVCSDVATDRVLLAKAKTKINNNHYLISSYTYAINRGKPGDIAKQISRMEYKGHVHHVNSYHYSNGPHQFLTLYYIYSPESIMDRYSLYEKHILKKNKLDALLKTEE
jgi:hypothetical protein